MVSFQDIAKTVAGNWKVIEPATKAYTNAVALLLKERQKELLSDTSILPPVLSSPASTKKKKIATGRKGRMYKKILVERQEQQKEREASVNKFKQSWEDQFKMTPRLVSNCVPDRSMSMLPSSAAQRSISPQEKNLETRRNSMTMLETRRNHSIMAMLETRRNSMTMLPYPAIATPRSISPQDMSCLPCTANSSHICGGVETSLSHRPPSSASPEIDPDWVLDPANPLLPNNKTKFVIPTTSSMMDNSCDQIIHHMMCSEESLESSCKPVDVSDLEIISFWDSA